MRFRTPRRRTRTLMVNEFESLEPRLVLSSTAYSLAGVDVVQSAFTRPVAEANGELYVGAGSGLLRCDGDTTTKVTGGPVQSLFDWNGVLYFQGGSVPTDGLYRLDPGSSSPVEIKAEGQTRISSASSFLAAGSKLYFAASGGIFVTDGTSPGTHLIQAGTPIGTLGNRVLFAAGSSNDDLYISDGTAQGTIKIGSGIKPYGGVELNGIFIFNALNGTYRTDGTAAGTTAISTVRLNSDMRRVGNAVYGVQAVTEGETLYKTDGTPAGTVKIQDNVILPDSVAPLNQPTFASVGDTLYFMAFDGARIAQLYSTTGPGTTKKITNFTGASGYTGVVKGLVQVNGQLFFAARDAMSAYSVWTSNGGVGDYHPINGLTPDSNAIPLNLVSVGGSLYFTRQLLNSSTVLWRYAVSPVNLADDGTLVVNGTDPAEGGTGGDSILLSRSGTDIVANVDGQNYFFPAASVNRITVNAMGGDDSLYVVPNVYVGPTAQLTYNAGSGNESFQADGSPGGATIGIGRETISMVGGQASHSVSLRGVESVTVSGSSGDDSIIVNANPTQVLKVDGQDGNDSVTVGVGSLESITGQVELAGGLGLDSLHFDDSTNTQTGALTNDDPQGINGDRYALSDSQLARTRATNRSIQTFTESGFEAGISLSTGSRANLISVVPSSLTSFTVSAGDPQTRTPALVGDALVIKLNGASGAALAKNGAGAGEYTFANRKPVDFSNVELPDDLSAPLLARSTFVNGVLPQQLLFRFSEPVIPSGLTSKFSLLNRTTGVTIPLTVLPSSYDVFSDTITFTFDGASMGLLPRGEYRATFPAGSITDISGRANEADASFDFAIVPGDTDGDGQVGFADLVAVAQNYNTVGATLHGGDVNYDGKVGFADLVQVAQHFSETVTLPASTGGSGVGSPAGDVPSQQQGGAPIVPPLPAPQAAATPVGIALDLSWGKTGKVITDLSDGGISEDYLTDATLTSGGQLAVVGSTPDYSRADLIVARYNNDGTLDNNFGVKGVAHYHALDDTRGSSLYAQDDGKIIAAGWAKHYYGSVWSPSLVLVRFNPDGKLDPTFGDQGATVVANGTVGRMLVLSDGKILIGGHIGYGGWDSFSALWRFNSDGTVDRTFGTNGLMTIDQRLYDQGMSPQVALPGGRALVVTDKGIQRLNADGTFDPSFLIGSGVVTLAPDGKILVVNQAYVQNSSNVSVTRYTADGAVDESFGTLGGTVNIDFGGDDSPASLVFQDDGKLLIGGTSINVRNRSTVDFAIARLLPNGTLDTAFGTGGILINPFGNDHDARDTMQKLIYANDKLLAVGNTQIRAPEDLGNINVSENFAIARYVLDPQLSINTGGPYGPINEGSVFGVTAVGSTYAGGQILKYEWDYGYDGRGFSVDAQGLTAQLTAGNDPSAIIGLRVTTADGLQAITSTTVSITNVAPVAEAGPPEIGVTGAPVKLALSATDVVADSIVFSIDWGDGTVLQTTSAQTGTTVSTTVSHTYASRGTFTVTVTAANIDGKSTIDTTTVRIGDVLASIYIDANGNGGQEQNELPVKGQRVFIDLNRNGVADPGEPATVTDNNGQALFDGLAPDVYSVQIEPVKGYQFGTPPFGTANVTVASGAGAILNFGVSRYSSIAGSVFNDTDGNGVWNLGELPLQSISVLLTSAASGTVYQTYTDQFGNYRFQGLLPGTYVVRASSSSYSQNSPGGGRGRIVNLDATTTARGIDLAMRDIVPGTVSGTVFEDANGNGARDATEQGTIGRVVYIDVNDNGVLDTDELSTTVDSSGNYSFVSLLLPGTYSIRLVSRGGWSQTLPTNAISVTVQPGVAKTGLDFGTHKDDVTAPTVLSAAYDSAQSLLTLKLSETVVGLKTGVLTLSTTGGQGVALILMSYDPISNVAIFSPSAGPLAAGDYHLKLPRGNISDLAGNTLAADFIFDFTVGVATPARLPAVGRGTVRLSQPAMFNAKKLIK